jgi:hypothetical protein
MNAIQRIGNSRRWSDVVINAGVARWVEVAEDVTADTSSKEGGVADSRRVYQQKRMPAKLRRFLAPYKLLSTSLAETRFGYVPRAGCSEFAAVLPHRKPAKINDQGFNSHPAATGREVGRFFARPPFCDWDTDSRPPGSLGGCRGVGLRREGEPSLLART